MSVLRERVVDEGGVGWEAVEGAPGGRLQGWVNGYGGFRELSEQPVVRQELPSPEIVLIVNLSGPLAVRRASATEVRPAAFVAGVGHSLVSTSHAGAHSALEVRIPGPGAGVVLGVPAGELAEQVVDLADLWGAAAAQLVDRLSAASWQQRFAVAEAFLLTRAARSPARLPPPEMRSAYDLMVDHGGDVTLALLRELTGWSRRRLAGQFREHTGLTPKALSRLVRFRRAERLLRGPGHRSLASIAVTCGYYDQAHFNRDFRELAGCTPTAYLARLRAAADSTTSAFG